MVKKSKETSVIPLYEKSLMMVSLGCAKNLVDSESMCHAISEAGIKLVQDPLSADIIVINTCGFIETAKKEAIDKILEMAQYKDANTRFLIVTGCLAQRYSKEIQQLIPEVDAILGTAAYDRLLDTIKELYGRRMNDCMPCDVVPPVVHTEGRGSLRHLSTKRIPTTNGYAYIKIAEGCFNRCAYCAIPDIRGTLQSRSMEDLVSEASNLAEYGIYEVVLIAQDTTSYGLDLYGYPALPGLIRRISEIGRIRTIRILYCYAEGITEELIHEMQINPKVAHYIDMPIQHSHDSVLLRMNRRDTKQKIMKVIRSLRKSIPDIVIRTTVMVGFPGETEKEFQDLLQFINRIKFDLLGCFVFSPEEGTAAYSMKPRIAKKTAKSRYDVIMAAQKDIMLYKNAKKNNKKFEITIESITPDGVFYLGRSYAQAPEIDPMVLVVATARALEFGERYWVRIIETSDYELIGVTK